MIKLTAVMPQMLKHGQNQVFRRPQRRRVVNVLQVPEMHGSGLRWLRRLDNLLHSLRLIVIINKLGFIENRSPLFLLISCQNEIILFPGFQVFGQFPTIILLLIISI